MYISEIVLYSGIKQLIHYLYTIYIQLVSRFPISLSINEGIDRYSEGVGVGISIYTISVSDDVGYGEGARISVGLGLSINI